MNTPKIYHKNSPELNPHSLGPTRFVSLEDYEELQRRSMRPIKIGAVAPWFGSARSIARKPAELLGALDWCGVPFAGGMPELQFIQCRGGVANDLHRHVINLARTIRSQPEALVERLSATVFHPDELKRSQFACLTREAKAEGANLFMNAVPNTTLPEEGDLDWAVDYFVCAWMGQGGYSGREHEFKQNLAIRFTSSGGTSSVRFSSAIESILGWSDVLRRWEFSTLDVFGFFTERFRDQKGHGLYCDPPWPDAGDEYRHAVGTTFHERLAKTLRSFVNARVVVRYGIHPLIEYLYPRSAWEWVESTTSNQQGNEVKEVLLCRGPFKKGNES